MARVQYSRKCWDKEMAKMETGPALATKTGGLHTHKCACQVQSLEFNVAGPWRQLGVLAKLAQFWPFFLVKIG